MPAELLNVCVLATMGNMYEHHAILGEEFRRYRSPEVARALNPALQSFDQWLSANASRIQLG